jgi:polyisoprenyl-phosphate glycosyltransferase
MSRPLNLISLVLPIYNEEEVLPLLLARLDQLLWRLPCPAEVVFVNDGSRDQTGVLLEAAAASRPHLKVIEFSRNFGHQTAITAGTDFAAGDVVVIMDGDLQDPPELVLDMIQKYQEGFDVVYARRTARHGETWFKRVTAAAFYWLMKKMVHRDLPRDTGDFRLMSRPVAGALRRLREQHRFVRGMVTWVGFRQTAIEFERPARAAGQTKYPLRKMFAFAWGAITSFSGLPLRVALFAGAGMLATALMYALYSGYKALVLGDTVPGWASLVCLHVGLSGATLLVLGLIGDYIARIYEELKGRPLYIVRSLHNLSPDALPADLSRASVCVEPDVCESNSNSTPFKRAG